MIKRRTALLALPALCALSLAGAQASKMYRIGVLGVHPFPYVPADPDEQALLDELARRGLVVGRNLEFVSRASGNDLQRLDALAGELVALKVDLILSIGGTPSALAAKRATSTTPILLLGARDPVEDGLAASLSRPGGNLTGNADMGHELVVKRMQLLREAVRQPIRIGYLVHERFLARRSQLTAVSELEAVLRAQGGQLVTAPVREVTQGDDLDQAFDRLVGQRVQAVVIDNYATIGATSKRVAAVLTRHRLPAIMEDASYARSGVLMTYTEPSVEAYLRIAQYVQRILAGASPAELPMMRPTRFELVINLQTAKVLGIEIPQSLLQRADELIR